MYTLHFSSAFLYNRTVGYSEPVLYGFAERANTSCWRACVTLATWHCNQVYVRNHAIESSKILPLEADQGEQIKCDNYIVASGADRSLKESKESSGQKADDITLVCQEDQTASLLVQKDEDQATVQYAGTCAPPPEQKEAQISEQKVDVEADEAIRSPLEIDASAGVSERQVKLGTV